MVERQSGTHYFWLYSSWCYYSSGLGDEGDCGGGVDGLNNSITVGYKKVCTMYWHIGCLEKIWYSKCTLFISKILFSTCYIYLGGHTRLFRIIGNWQQGQYGNFFTVGKSIISWKTSKDNQNGTTCKKYI